MSGNLAVSTINGVDISVSPVATESKVIGVGQTWQDVTASRALGTTYTNSTGKPIALNLTSTNVNASGVSITVNGLLVTQMYLNNGVTGSSIGTVIVPNGGTYSVIMPNAALLKWFELR